MKKLIQNFIYCGILGWCLEITFTALDSFRRREFKLKGNTSIWMFPIYGMASFLSPICKLIKHQPVWVRGGIYASLIFAAEYITGTILTKKQLCPWNYARSKWNVNQLIRLDYAPCWFFTGLLFEKLLSDSHS